MFTAKNDQLSNAFLGDLLVACLEECEFEKNPPKRGE